MERAENIRNDNVDDDEGPVKLDGPGPIRPITLNNVFKEKLAIPDYQRGYCWGEMQVKCLLESLWLADKTKPYHLGTIVIHEHDKICDVVDGQQRLITLALLIQKLQPTNENIFRFLRANLTNDPDVKLHLRKNYATIGEWIYCHPIGQAELCKWLLQAGSHDGVCISVVRIVNSASADDALPLAWTFFDAFNSAGKRLSDYDLLKAHHLRYLSKGEDLEEKESLILNKASIWDRLGQETIESFNGETALLVQTLGLTLYLVRSWIRNRWAQVGSMPADGRYEVLRQYSALTGFVSADMPMIGLQAGIVGGKSFFDWTERHISLYRAFIANSAVHCFQEMPWKDAQTHLRIIARATCFFYYCKFGDVYMADAIVLILYRLGKLRNTRFQRAKWYNHDLVKHTIEAIDESPTPEYFFHYCQMPSNRYVRYYNLKDASENEKLALGWRHGPDFWKKLLILTSSSNPFGLNGLGRFICFKKKVHTLFNDIARDFEWSLSSDLSLSKGEQYD